IGNLERSPVCDVIQGRNGSAHNRNLGSQTTYCTSALGSELNRSSSNLQRVLDELGRRNFDLGELDFDLDSEESEVRFTDGHCIPEAWYLFRCNIFLENNQYSPGILTVTCTS